MLDSRHSVNIYDFIGNGRVVIMWFYVISTLQSWTPSPQHDYHPDRPLGPWWLKRTENLENWNFNNVNVNL